MALTVSLYYSCPSRLFIGVLSAVVVVVVAIGFCIASVAVSDVVVVFSVAFIVVFVIDSIAIVSCQFIDLLRSLALHSLHIACLSLGRAGSHGAVAF